jgi:hypothetical protein
MKPDWDKLMDAYAGSATQLIGDVDCTAEGKSLCDANGVKGYPTIKWGDPSDLEDYKGGRDYASLEKFAETSLKPLCSPTNIDLCDDDKKAEIQKFQAMTAKDLDDLIAGKETELEEVESTFKAAVAELQATYQDLTTGKEAKLAEISDSGLGLMKSVKASASDPGKDEL